MKSVKDLRRRAVMVYIPPEELTDELWRDISEVAIPVRMEMLYARDAFEIVLVGEIFDEVPKLMKFPLYDLVVQGGRLLAFRSWDGRQTKSLRSESGWESR